MPASRAPTLRVKTAHDGDGFSLAASSIVSLELAVLCAGTGSRGEAFAVHSSAVIEQVVAFLRLVRHDAAAPTEAVQQSELLCLRDVEIEDAEESIEDEPSSTVTRAFLTMPVQLTDSPVLLHLERPSPALSALLPTPRSALERLELELTFVDTAPEILLDDELPQRHSGLLADALRTWARSRLASAHPLVFHQAWRDVRRVLQ